MSLIGKIPYKNHGRRHRPGGSDPLPGVIVYDAYNVGGWLKIDTTGVGAPVAGLGIYLQATDGQITLNSDDLINLIAPQVLAQVDESFVVRLGGSGAVFQVDSVGTGPYQIVAEWQGDVKVGIQDASKAWKVQNDTGNDLMSTYGDGSTTFTLYDNGAYFLIQDSSATAFPFYADLNLVETRAPNTRIRITSGSGIVAVYDSSNNLIFVVNEDGSLQGKTGQSLVFDL